MRCRQLDPPPPPPEVMTDGELCVVSAAGSDYAGGENGSSRNVDVEDDEKDTEKKRTFYRLRDSHKSGEPMHVVILAYQVYL